MPNRIIKESICTSENIDQLTSFEETVFFRLLVNCDDFGRFHGNPKILSSRLFPLKSISSEEMTNALKSLVNADLVTVYEVDGKQFVQVNTWDKHQTPRAKKSKYPSPDESTCNQLQADDSKCPRYRNRYTINDIRYSESESFITEDDAAAIQAEQNEFLDIAEKAGFGKTDAIREKLLSLFAQYGKDKMQTAIESCVNYGVSTIAYLKAVLEDRPRKQKKVVGQQYTQRDYSDEDAEAIQRMLRMGAG